VVADCPPLVAVIVRLNGATPVVHVTPRIAPEKLAVQPGGRTVVVEKVTVPVEPVTVQVDVAVVVANCVKLFGEHATERVEGTTGTLTVRDSVLGAVPVVPVTITLNGATAVHETERTAPVKLAVQPAGTAPAENVTAPANPLIGLTEIVEVPAVPAVRVIVDGFADKMKS
jgi:hypothetical protein